MGHDELTRRPNHPHPQRVVAANQAHARDECLRLVLTNDEAGFPVGHHFGNVADVRRNHRHSAGHRLEDGARPSFLLRRAQENVHRWIKCGGLFRLPGFAMDDADAEPLERLRERSEPRADQENADVWPDR